jgi:secondary thiamine-phosphate synthase enzyme
MKIIQETIAISTSCRCEMIDITSKVASAVSASGITAGAVTVFCPHTTAAITINENADPDVISDILLTLEELFPQNRPGYRHCEGNSDAHIKCSLVGSSEHIFIKGGRMTLGVWQGIYFCEFDGPRNRKIIMQIQGQ